MGKTLTRMPRQAQREVLAAKAAALEQQRGTSRVRRWGEQYLMTCACGAAVVTSDEAAVTRFRAVHAGHDQVPGPAGHRGAPLGREAPRG